MFLALPLLKVGVGEDFDIFHPRVIQDKDTQVVTVFFKRQSLFIVTCPALLSGNNDPTHHLRGQWWKRQHTHACIWLVPHKHDIDMTDTNMTSTLRNLVNQHSSCLTFYVGHVDSNHQLVPHATIKLRTLSATGTSSMIHPNKCQWL